MPSEAVHSWYRAALSASKPDFGYQPATNVDGYRYVMNRFSTFFKDRR